MVPVMMMMVVVVVTAIFVNFVFFPCERIV